MKITTPIIFENEDNADTNNLYWNDIENGSQFSRTSVVKKLHELRIDARNITHFGELSKIKKKIREYQTILDSFCVSTA